MLSPADFVASFRSADIRVASGVPCSLLNSVQDQFAMESSLKYVTAYNEGEAAAICAGAALAGNQSVLLCQNSGLGNIVNTVTSLHCVFSLPLLLVISWRGNPQFRDEPQHKLMGTITLPQLELLGFKIFLLDRNLPDATNWSTVQAALAHFRQENGLTAIVVDDGIFPKSRAHFQPAARHGERIINRLPSRGVPLARQGVLEILLTSVEDDDAIITTTGKCSRELFSISDRRQHFYVLGSMGAASAIGLGVALETDKRVFVVDGDGAALMHLGNLASVGRESPSNYVHLLIDNGCYESTGGQPTSSENVDFALLASACGYRNSYLCDCDESLRESLRSSRGHDGPTFIHCRVRVGASSPQLGRPDVPPSLIAERFGRFLRADFEVPRQYAVGVSK